VLVSSFFGPTQEGSYSNDLWDLIADDTGQGNRLCQNFLGMRDRATAPVQTRFAATTYYFSVKLKGGLNASAKKQPFDALRLAWHDYPGEWFEESPSSEEEARRRIDTFRSLLRSDVAIFLVDGQKLVDYAGEEERYLKSLMTSFRQGLLRLKEDLLADEERLIEFPRIWIMALSKADLLPDWDVNTFRDLLIGKAAGDMDGLRTTLKEFVDTPEAVSLGEDFMLLSSAKFQLASTSPEPVEIDVTKRLGIKIRSNREASRQTAEARPHRRQGRGSRTHRGRTDGRVATERHQCPSARAGRLPQGDAHSVQVGPRAGKRRPANQEP
jgi:hypothetical protein